MDKIDRLKQERVSRNWAKQCAAPLLMKVAPDIDYIEVVGTFHFTHALCSIAPQPVNQTLRPEGKCYLNISCINKDCTSDGFDLTSSLEKAIRDKSSVNVVERCDGKEDWRYLDATGCSCQTTLECSITPHFKA